MILITGGAGFIGSHTVRALTDLGRECVLLQRRSAEVPPHLSDLPVHMVQGDVSNLDDLLAAGRRFPIDGIINLALALPWPMRDDNDPVDASGQAVEGFLNIVRAARTWGVRRIVTASTIGVYGDVTTAGALAEDLRLSLNHFHAIPTFKKITELLGGYLTSATGIEIVNARISGTWGPLGHLPDPFFAAPSLARAAAHRTEPDLSGLVTPPRAEDALDLLYVKDTGQALALLQTTAELHHPTYNIGSGRATSNADVIAAIAAVEPSFSLELPTANPGRRNWLDITRLRQDTSFEPRYDVTAAAADYISWLRLGNKR